MHDCLESEWTILAIDINGLNINEIGPDNYELPDFIAQGNIEALEAYNDWTEVPWQVSLEVCSQVAYYAEIQPNLISINHKRFVNGSLARQKFPAP